MFSIEAVAKVGGIFALLTLAHFISDWLFQSHAEAMAKTKDSWVRARHCLIYTVLMGGSIWLLFRPTFEVMAVIAVTLWFSHFVEDTYLPVYVWAKYLRKPFEMINPGIEGFKAFADTGLGKILLITVDQIVHLAFLVPVATILVCPSRFFLITGWAFTGLGFLWAIALVGKKAV